MSSPADFLFSWPDAAGKIASELPDCHGHNDEKYHKKAVKNLALILPLGLTNN